METAREYAGCDFCKEINGEENLYWELAQRYDLPKDRRVYEGENWVIWPTIGAILPGYVLLVSKKHRRSIMDCDKEERKELDRLLQKTRQILEDAYHCPCIAFEHGGGCPVGNTPSCIDHCHLHVLPLKEEIYHRIDKNIFQITPLQALGDLCGEGQDHSAYLLYQDHGGKFFLIHGETYISQYFRQLVALSENIPEKWNWRTYHFPENIRKTLDDIKPIFSTPKP